MNGTILDCIVASRRERIKRYGFAPQSGLLDSSQYSAVPFVNDPLVICEIKRRSPSRGDILSDLDPVAQASIYKQQGVRSISVLTEEEYFAGSLNDLVTIKAAFPKLSLLRKDFLLEEEDIRVSYRAGADAILLIAAILNPEKLADLYALSLKLGLTPLVELHNADELKQIRLAGIKPKLLGINARNLNNFQVDLLSPLSLRKQIDWPCRVVFESGIFSVEQAALAALHGFSGVLVGEAAIKNPTLAGKLGQALVGPENYPAAGAGFWTEILQILQVLNSQNSDCLSRPLVKVCGICNLEDAHVAAELGADILGFVFALSPRQANIELLQKIEHIDVLKVAVLCESPNKELREAWHEGLIDAFQYHGDEDPQECLTRGLPFYKAIRLKQKEDVKAIMNYSSPRVLIDAWSSYNTGGTGKRIDGELVRSAIHKPLWLAGGINPQNVANIIRDYRPELIDAASGLESRPGKKDHTKLKAFFKEIDSASVQ